jgi:hypothetical protein
MTVTISRLYDSYAQATEAVSNLEKAGVPHNVRVVSSSGYPPERQCPIGRQVPPSMRRWLRPRRFLVRSSADQGQALTQFKIERLDRAAGR